MKNLFFPLEILAAVAVYVIPLEKRRNIPALLCAAALLIGSALFFTAGVDYFSDIYYREAALQELLERYIGYISAGTVFLQLIVIMTAAVKLVCRISLKEAVYCITCAYLTEHIAYCIRLIINGISGETWADSGKPLYFLIHIAVYAAAYLILAKKMVREGHYATGALSSAGLMISTLFVVLLMSMAASRGGFEFLHGIYAIFCCVFVLYGQIKQQRQLNLQAELGMQKQLWIKSKTQYEMAKENIDIINRKCHDLKHQVAALRTIDNLEKRSSVIDSIEDSVMIYDSMLKTGNEILDTVLTEKSLLCSQKHISLTCIADGKQLEFMDAVDLYTIFGNALDNAIEGVQGLPEEERAVSILLHEKAGLIFVQIENRYQGEIVMKDGLPVTSKPDKNYHGFGVRSIVQTTEKYHGFVTIEAENGIFLLRLTFPASQAQNQV